MKCSWIASLVINKYILNIYLWSLLYIAIMASYHLTKKLPRHIAVEYYKLKSLWNKIERTSSSIGFIYKAIFHEVIPTVVKVNGQFVNMKDKYKAENSILQSHLRAHRHNLNDLCSKHTAISDSLKNKVGMLLFNCLYSLMVRSSGEDNINQLKCKNKNLRWLISQKPVNRDNYNKAVVNLSSHDLGFSRLKYGLHQSFTDKNRHIKQNLAVKFEALSLKLDSFIKEDLKENFHEYLRSVMNIMSNNVYRDKHNSFKLLKRLRKNENIAVLSTGKESCMVILNKTDYINKVNAMINESISKGKYVKAVDCTHKDLKHFQNFLYRDFYKTEHYGMRPISNQFGCFFATVKMHKFDSIENLNVKDLNLRPIIDQTGTLYIWCMKGSCGVFKTTC